MKRTPLKRSWMRRKPPKVDQAWIQARAAQLTREPTCKACGATVGLCVHHAGRNGVGMRDHEGPLWTLCWKCHRELHDHGKQTFALKYGLEGETP